MRKSCCTILTVVFALAFAATTLASDFVLEFYLQAGSAPVVPIKNLHCMLIDSNKNSVLDERLEDEEICRVGVSLEEGLYSLIVEEPASHYFGSANVVVSSHSSSSMVFLLNNLGLNLLEGVHSCEGNLACLNGEECFCDDECVCKRFHNEVLLQTVGQTKKSEVSSSTKVLSTETKTKHLSQSVIGQPGRPSCAYSNVCCGTVSDVCCAVCEPTGRFGWGSLGLLGLLGLAIQCPGPGPISEDPDY